MKVLTIGSDKKLFQENSTVLARSILYARHMEELHIIIFTLKEDNHTPMRIDNLFLYPTNSGSKLGYIMSAYGLGKDIIPYNKFVRGEAVISAQDPFESGLVAYLLSKRFRLPLQLQIHTDFLSPHFKNNFLNRVRAFIASFLVPRAEGLRVVSQRIVESLWKQFLNLKAHPEVLPIFVDMAGIKYQEAKKDLKLEYPQFNFIFFMASRLTKEKNIDTALRALAEIIPLRPTVGLVIAGEGDQLNHLESLVRSLHLEGHVIFIGWQNDLISFYKTANAYLLTSAYEGYGMGFIEAAAAGVPIITTPVGIAESMCRNGDNSFVCPVGDIHCFAENMKDLISDNAKRELFKHRIQDSIQSLATDREKYVEAYVGLLNKLVFRK